MWIRRIEVRHCAGIAAGAVDLQRGFNVLHGPNELGKSTLVSALRAAFLLSATSSHASALQDWNAQPAFLTRGRDDRGGFWSCAHDACVALADRKHSGNSNLARGRPLGLPG